MQCCSGRKTKRRSERMQRQEMTERARNEEGEQGMDLEEDTVGVELSQAAPSSRQAAGTNVSIGYIKAIANIYGMSKQQETSIATAQANLINAIERAVGALQMCQDHLKQCDSKLGEWSAIINSDAATEGNNEETITKLKDALLSTTQLRALYVLTWTNATKHMSTASSWCTKAAGACESFLGTAQDLEQAGRDDSDTVSVWFTQYTAAMQKLRDLYNDLGAMCTSCLNYIDDQKFTEDILATLHDKVQAIPNKGAMQPQLRALDEAISATSATLADLSDLTAAQVENLDAAPRSHFETLDVVNAERLSLDKEYFTVLLASSSQSIDETLLEDIQSYEVAAFACMLAVATAKDNTHVYATCLSRAKEHVAQALEHSKAARASEQQLADMRRIADALAVPTSTCEETLNDIEEKQDTVVSEVQAAKADILAAFREDPRTDTLTAVQKMLVTACEEAFGLSDRYLRNEDAAGQAVRESEEAMKKELIPFTSGPTQKLNIPPANDDDTKSVEEAALSFITALTAAHYWVECAQAELRPESGAAEDLNDKMEEMFDVAFFLVDTALAHSAKDPRVVKLVSGAGPLGLKLQTSHGTRGVRVVGTALNSQARRTGMVFPGDAVCKVNERDVTQDMHEDVIALIGQQHGTIEFELARDFPPAPRYLTLKRAPEFGLGFTLSMDQGRHVVQEVLPGSPAYETQQLKPGQYLLEIDGETTEGMSLQEVSNRLRSSAEVNICVGPYPHDAAAGAQPNVDQTVRSGDDFDTAAAVLQSINVPPPDDLPPGCRTVQLRRSEGPLGMRIKSLRDRPGVYIASFVENSQAEHCPDLHENDYIVSVNGNNVVNASHHTVVDLIKNLQDDVITITVSATDPLEWSQQQRQAVDTQAAAGEQQQQQQQQQPAAAEAEAGAEAGATQDDKQARPRRKVVLQRAEKEPLGMVLGSGPSKNEIVVHRVIDDTAAAKAGVFAGDQVCSVNGESTAGKSLGDMIEQLKQTTGDVTMQLQDPPVPPADVVRKVRLHKRDSEQLGLRLQSRGTAERAIILEVLPTGAASRNKMLCPNDQILSINGTSIVGMQHRDIIERLRDAGSEITLEVQQVSHAEQPQEQQEKKQEQPQEQQEKKQDGDKATAAAAGGEGVEGPAATVLDVTDEDRAAFPGAENMRKVTLHRSASRPQFGLQFAVKRKIAKVQHIVPGQLAASSGVLRQGDIVLSINGRNVYQQEVNVREAIQSSNDVTMLVASAITPAEAADTQQGTAAGTAAAAADQTASDASPLDTSKLRTIRVVKRGGQRLGLALLSHAQDKKGAQVYGVFPDGAASGVGFEAGDRIVSINGKHVANTDHQEIVVLLSSESEFDVGVLPGDVQRVTVRRPSASTSLGLALASLHEQAGIIISDVLRGTPAAATGRLQPGQLLVGVDGQMTGHLPKEKVLHMLAGKLEITLSVLNNPAHASSVMRGSSEATTEATAAAEAEEEGGDVFVEAPAERKHATGAAAPASALGRKRHRSFRRFNTITFKKEQGASLGMKLRSTTDKQGAIVEQVIPGGVAEKHGIVRGDRILAVDGQDVVSEPHTSIVERLKTRDTFTIKFDSNAKRMTPRTTITINKRANEPLGMRLCTVGGYTFVHELIPGSAASDSELQVNDRVVSINAVSVDGLSNQEVTKIFAQNDPVIVEVESTASPTSADGVEMQRRMSEARRAHEYHAPDLRKIVLERKHEEHFGVEIGLTSKEHGIIITKLREGGVARRDGRLFEGDAVLAINGKSMLHPLPEEAHAALAGTEERLELVVASDFPEQYIVTRMLMRDSVDTPWGLMLRKIPGKDGVHVVDVVPDSPSHRAGLRPDDRVTHVDGEDVEGSDTDAILSHVKDLLGMQLTVRRPAVLPGGFEQHQEQQQQQQHATQLKPGETVFSPEPLPTPSAVGKPPTATFLPPTILRSVSLTKQPNMRLGFSVVTDDNGTVVQSVDPTGLAAKTKDVHQGDVIISVNDIDVTNCSMDDVLEVLSQSPRVRLLLVDRYPLVGRAQTHIENVREHPVHGPFELRVFRLRKGSGSLGASLQTRKTDNLTVVKSLEDDSPAAESGLLVGDIILAINGKSVEEADHPTVLEVVRSDVEVVLVVARHVTRRARIKRDSQAGTLGLSLATAPAGVLTIANIAPASPAAQTGLLFPSDRVLRVNGVDMNGKTIEEAVSALQQGDEVTVVVEPMGSVTYRQRQEDVQVDRPSDLPNMATPEARASPKEADAVAAAAATALNTTTSTSQQQQQEQQQQEEQERQSQQPSQQQKEAQDQTARARLAELQDRNSQLEEQVSLLKAKLKRSEKTHGEEGRPANGVVGGLMPGEEGAEADGDDDEEADIIDDDSFVIMGSSLTEDQMRALAGGDEDVLVAEQQTVEQAESQKEEKQEQQQEEGQQEKAGAVTESKGDEEEQVLLEDTGLQGEAGEEDAAWAATGEQLVKVQEENDRLREELKQLREQQHQQETARAKAEEDEEKAAKDDAEANVKQLEEKSQQLEEAKKASEEAQLERDQAKQLLAQTLQRLKAAEEKSQGLEEKAAQEQNKDDEKKQGEAGIPVLDPAKLQELEDKLEDACQRADAEQLARQELEVELSQVKRQLTQAKSSLDDKAVEENTLDTSAKEAVSTEGLENEVAALKEKAESDHQALAERDRTIQSLKQQLDRRSSATTSARTSQRRSTSGTTRSTSPQRNYRPIADDPVDKAVARIVNDMNVPPSSVMRHQAKQYRFFGDSKLVHIRTVGNVVMARVGGGWQNLREYIKEHHSQR